MHLESNRAFAALVNVSLFEFPSFRWKKAHPAHPTLNEVIGVRRDKDFGLSRLTHLHFHFHLEHRKQAHPEEWRDGTENRFMALTHTFNSTNERIDRTEICLSGHDAMTMIGLNE